MKQKESIGALEARLVDAATKVEIGARYQHYKGHSYTVITIAILEATNEPCVVYQAEYGNNLVFVRPVTSWVEEVKIEGKVVRRFTKV